MGSEYTFYDYMEGGVNVIQVWLNGIPTGARVKFNTRLIHLEATPPGQWARPFVDTLDGHCAGLFEIRVPLSHQQYRIIGSHMGADRTPTLLHCFIKRGDKVPKVECDSAKEIKNKVLANPAMYRVEHNYA